MIELPETSITSFHTYNVNTGWDNCSMDLSPQTLLDISAYVQANRTKLEQEAQENLEIHAQQADTAETHPVTPEWCYRIGDLRLSPPPTGGRSVDAVPDEDTAYNQRTQRRLHRVNPEWRYRTGDLRLSPLPAESRSADDSTDEGAEYNLHALSRNERDTHSANPEWRYRTSDLR